MNWFNGLSKVGLAISVACFIIFAYNGIANNDLVMEIATVVMLPFIIVHVIDSVMSKTLNPMEYINEDMIAKITNQLSKLQKPVQDQAEEASQIQAEEAKLKEPNRFSKITVSEGT